MSFFNLTRLTALVLSGVASSVALPRAARLEASTVDFDSWPPTCPPGLFGASAGNGLRLLDSSVEGDSLFAQALPMGGVLGHACGALNETHTARSGGQFLVNYDVKPMVLLSTIGPFDVLAVALRADPRSGDDRVTVQALDERAHTLASFDAELVGGPNATYSVVEFSPAFSGASAISFRSALGANIAVDDLVIRPSKPTLEGLNGGTYSSHFESTANDEDDSVETEL